MKKIWRKIIPQGQRLVEKSIISWGIDVFGAEKTWKTFFNNVNNSIDSSGSIYKYNLKIAILTERSQSIVESDQDNVTIEDVTGSKPVVLTVAASHVESPAVNPHHHRKKMTITAGRLQL